MLSFDGAVVPPALPRLRLRYRLSPGLWVLLRLLCAGSWALRCLVLYRFRLLLHSALPFLVAVPPPALVLVALRRAFARARGRSSALCATARGHFAAYCSAFPVAPLLRAVLSLVALLAPALLLVGLPFCLCLDSWVLRRLL